MLIRYASDLHIEFLLNRAANMTVEGATLHCVPSHPDDKDAVLVLAGDIVARDAGILMQVLGYFKQRFAAVVFVPGNHEYYHSHYQKWNAAFTEAMAEARKWVAPADLSIFASTDNVDCVVIDGVRFVFGTLWGHGGHDLQERGRVGNILNDFRIIGFESGIFSVSQMIEINAKHSAAIKKYLQEPFNGKTVVVTHHLPTDMLCHPRFGTDINGGFASSEESVFAADYAPDYWIFGHTHDSIDTVLGATRCLCNPKGYPGEHRNDSPFNSYSAKFIEV